MSETKSNSSNRIWRTWSARGSQLTITLFVILLGCFICKTFGSTGKLPEPPKGRIPGVIAVAVLEHARPERAMKAVVEGNVDLDIVIGKTGRIEMLRVTKGSPLLAGAAADAVEQWSYEPTLLNGKPVGIRTTVSINFKISRDRSGSSTDRPIKIN